jgi:hypothetical protein
MRYELCAVGLPEAGRWKSDPAFADVNGDGHVDIGGVPRLGQGPRVFLGDGRGNWTESSDGLSYFTSCGGGVRFADVNRDGRMDLAVADHCQGIFVFLGDGAGHWTAVTSHLHPPIGEGETASLFTGVEDLDVGDVNGDGHLDLVGGGSDESGINVYLGDGTGSNWTLKPTPSLPKEEWAVRVRLADVNRDGALDLLAGYSQGPRVWLNDGAGGWKPALQGLPSPLVRGLYSNVELGDLNGDGFLDLATANWVDGPEIYLRQGDGSWKRQGFEFPQLEGGAVSVRMGDLDRDGHLDLVVAGRLKVEGGFIRGVFALFNDGAGKMRFAEATGLPETGLSAIGGLNLGDVNGDGFPDILLGTGLSVETAPGPTEPILPQRLMVWCSQPSAPAGGR